MATYLLRFALYAALLLVTLSAARAEVHTVTFDNRYVLPRTQVLSPRSYKSLMRCRCGHGTVRVPLFCLTLLHAPIQDAQFLDSLH